jgi:hypothetical protein
MKHKLSRIRSPWRRLLVSLVLSCLVALANIQSPRARIHWVGNHARPRRLERVLFLLLLPIPILLLEPRQYLHWSLAWGSLASAFVVVYSFYKLAQRKRFQYIRQ